MNIDFHSHFIPASAIGAAETGKPWCGIEMYRSSTGALLGRREGVEFDLPEWTRSPADLSRRVAWLDAHQLDAQVLSIAPRLQRYRAEPTHAVEVARVMNDDLAELVAQGAGRLYGLMHLPLQDPQASVAELRRMADVPGILGAAAGTNVAGAPWDSPELFPVLAAVQELGLVLFLHPVDRPADPRMRRFHLKNLVGNPLETTLAIAALMFGGVLDRLTGIQLCFAHAGGYAVTGIGRFDAGYDAREDVRSLMARRPSDYLPRLYFDSITFSKRALAQVVETVGASQVVLGSDYPADMGDPDPVGFVASCETIGAVDRVAILGRNAMRLLERA